MSHVYVAACEGRTKIGITDNVAKRTRSIETAVGLPVVLISSREFRTRAEAWSVEQALHRCFRSDRLHGEWFNVPASHVVEMLSSMMPEAPVAPAEDVAHEAPPMIDEDDAAIAHLEGRLDPGARAVLSARYGLF